MLINKIVVERDGVRALSQNNKMESQCYGSEWPRRANMAFSGKIDVGGLNE